MQDIWIDDIPLNKLVGMVMSNPVGADKIRCHLNIIIVNLIS